MKNLVWNSSNQNVGTEKSLFLYKVHDYPNYFFYFSINEWSILHSYISNADSFKVFKKHILSFIRPIQIIPTKKKRK